MMFFRTAALRESQQVALDSELLDTMPKQYVNREEQTTLHLECRGSSGKKCQGAAVVTVQVRLSFRIVPRISFEFLILACHWKRLKEIFSTLSHTFNSFGESEATHTGMSPGEEHGNPLEYSCLENFLDRGAWWATVHGITQSWAWLKRSTKLHTKLITYFRKCWWVFQDRQTEMKRKVESLRWF